MRFSIRQLLCGVVVVAGLLAVVHLATRPEQFGRIVNQVTSVSFSPDGTRLAVVVHRAQDANVPFKAYYANVGHVAAILDATNLGQGTILAQRYLEGIQGPVHFGWPFHVEFTADSKYALLYEQRKPPEWWDIAAGKWRADRPDMGYSTSASHISPAGNAMVIYGEGKVEIRECRIR